MSITNVLKKISENYLTAKQEAFSGNNLAQYIRNQATNELTTTLNMSGINIHSSPGKGNWAEIPWIALMDPIVTETATKGYYVVYLFSANMERIYLSLNQGITLVKEEFNTSSYDILRERAVIIRARIPEYIDNFSSAEIDLHSTKDFPRNYTAGHAFGQVYNPSQLPPEETLKKHLQAMIKFYFKLTSRGGTDLYTEESINTEGQSIVEARRYRFHRRIERNAKASQAVKKAQGYTCNFNFQATYGAIGKDYIEAHHIIPLSELPEGSPTSYDPNKDFTVLCANCHRMIHKKDSPKDLDDFKLLIN